MSIEVSAEVWRHSKQRGSRLLLLVAIADYSNADGWAWPSIRSLCQRTRMGERYVQKMLREIQEDKELEIRERAGTSNFYRVTVSVKCEPHFPCPLCGTYDALVVHHIQPRGLGGTDAKGNRISICFPCHLLMHERQGVADLSDAGEALLKIGIDGCREELKKLGVNTRSPVANSGARGEPGCLNGVNRGAPNPSKEPSRNRQEGGIPLTPNGESSSSIKSKSAGFEEFWAAYPKKQKKETALRAWKRHVRPDKIEEIMLALAIQKGWAQWTKGKPPGQFIPYPASWINAHAWEDEEKSTIETKPTPAKKGF